MVASCTVKQRAVFVDREVRRNRRRELNQLHVLLCVVARQHVAAADSMAPTRLDARGACFVCLPERVPSGAAIFGGRRALRSSARAAFGMASSAPRSTCHLLASSVTASPLAIPGRRVRHRGERVNPLAVSLCAIDRQLPRAAVRQRTAARAAGAARTGAHGARAARRRTRRRRPAATRSPPAARGGRSAPRRSGRRPPARACRPLESRRTAYYERRAAVERLEADHSDPRRPRRAAPVAPSSRQPRRQPRPAERRVRPSRARALVVLFLRCSGGRCAIPRRPRRKPPADPWWSQAGRLGSRVSPRASQRWARSAIPRSCRQISRYGPAG